MRFRIAASRFRKRGLLAAGTYFVKYSFVNTDGVESFASPASANFTVGAGNIPRITLPPLPIGMTGYNLYLSDPTARASSAFRYLSNFTASTVNLAAAAPIVDIRPTMPNVPVTQPMVQAFGGGITGGLLQPGTYFVRYTFVDDYGFESYPSAYSAHFTVVAGYIPQVQLPPLPTGVKGINLYVSNVTADEGTETLYASLITPTLYFMRNAIPSTAALPSRAAATVAPTVTVTGGGTTGGTLPAGTYFVQYTFATPTGESFPSPQSANFTVAAGNIPQVALPPLPQWASGINVYLSNNTATAGSAKSYAFGVKATYLDLAVRAPSYGIVPPSTVVPTATPTVNPIGGGQFGGKLSAGTYIAYYTISYANGYETPASPISNAFSIVLGNVPRITLPTLPGGTTGHNIYLADPAAAPGTAFRYATGVTTTTYNFANNAPVVRPTDGTVVVQPVVVPTGGGSTGGALAAGTYYAFYTFNYISPYNFETSPSPLSPPFTIAAGNTPVFQMPLLPVGVLPVNATSYNIYLTDSVANIGTATRYATGITAPTLAMSAAAPAIGKRPPVTHANSTGPVVTPARGGSSGGALPAGNYFVQYTFAYPDEVESFPSPASNTFSQTAGAVPQVALPPMPAGAIGYNIYLSNSSAGAGSATRYATLVKTPYFNLTAAGPQIGVHHPESFNALIAPAVVGTGGGTTGGTLAQGTYFLRYAFSYPTGAESLPSPVSNTFTVNAGHIPQVTLPPLPEGATGYTIYLSNTTATAGSETRYAARVSEPLFNLSGPAQFGAINAPIDNLANAAPTVDPTGGGSSGGSLLPGAYFAYYTFVFPSGTETYPSPNSAPFAVAAGNIPRMTMPALPAGATSYRIYLSDVNANAGSARLYATGVTSSPFDFGANALAGRTLVPGANAWTAIPTVSVGGGGGAMFPGSYFVYYTFVNSAGLESFPSANSATFTLGAGQVPTVSLPALPAWASSINLYVSNPLAAPNSAMRYAAGITTTSYQMTGATPLFDNSPIALVNPTGGNQAGQVGRLAPGTYFVFFTLNDAVGSEVYASASSANFTVGALGDVPRVTLPTLPPWASSYNIYVSNSSAGLGSAFPYAAGVTTPYFDLVSAQHANGVTTLLVGDDFTLPADTLMMARREVVVRGDFADRVPGQTASNDPDMGTGVTMNIFSGIVAPFVLLQGEGDNDVFNVRVTVPNSEMVFDTSFGANTLNFSSTTTTIGGIVDNLQGHQLILGSGNDTLNLDDMASPGPKTGFYAAIVTPTLLNQPSGTITGLNMGAGFTHHGLHDLNVYNGAGGVPLPGSAIGNTSIINVPAGLNLPQVTTIFAGTSKRDNVTANWATDHNTILNLYQFETGTAAVGNDMTGVVNFGDGTLQSVTIGNSMTPGSIFNASNIDVMTIGPNALTVGKNLAGQLNVAGKLGSLRVAGGTPGTIVGGSIGTIAVYGGYGPVIGQIRENRVQRRIDADRPNDPYPMADETYVAGSPYVNFKYFYEGNGTGLYMPQLTARITNSVSNLPDQYDFNMMTYSDTAKFNLARLDSNGVSGARNVMVEGNLLSAVSGAAQTFIGGANNPAGVRLPQDQLAGVAIRDFAPRQSIDADSIQSVAFGSTLRINQFNPVTGSLLIADDAQKLLTATTDIVRGASTNGTGKETYRIPFADLPTQRVAFFLNTGRYDTAFDELRILFQNQANNGVKTNAARGAVSAHIDVQLGSYVYSPNEVNPIIQRLDLRGDGGSYVSELWVANEVTSTGSLGDTEMNQVLGIANLTAPGVFGDMKTYGPLGGTVQTTGLRYDPVTGRSTTAPSDFGRAYVYTDASGFLRVTHTGLVTESNGQPAVSYGSGIKGRLLVRGNLVSQVLAYGGISGIVAVEGDIGASSTLLSIASPTRVGGISTGFSSISGGVVALGRMWGDMSLFGELVGGGSVAIQGNIHGNVQVNGFGAGTSFLSGGFIGDPALGTGVIFITNLGIVAAKGAIVNKNSTVTLPGYWSSNASLAPDGIDAGVIDAIFSDPNAKRIAGIDYVVFGDLGGLTYMSTDLDLLHVAGGRLSL